jgi:two-component system NtrC family sensor kinase
MISPNRATLKDSVVRQAVGDAAPEKIALDNGGAIVAAAIVWGKHLATGHAQIDDDHRKLIELINNFSAAIGHPDEAAMLKRAVVELGNYAADHFMREESIMEATGVDRRHAGAHRQAHQSFVRYVSAIGQSVKTPLEIVQFLTRWLNIHILGVDHALLRQLRLIDGGMAPAEAFDLDTRSNTDPAMIALLEALDCTEQRAMREREATSFLLTQMMDGDPVPTFVIDASHRITHWNRACALITGAPAAELIGTNRQWAPFYKSERPTMADLIVSGALDPKVEKFCAGRFRRSPTVPDAYEAENFFPQFGEEGTWLFFTAAPLRDAEGRIIGAIETLQDVTERHRAEQALREHQKNLEATIAERTAELAEANAQMAEDIKRRELAEAELLKRYAELTELNIKLGTAQDQLVQSEKLASIGQLAAGVAHEINNPIGYVHSNIGSLENYLKNIFEMFDAYVALEHELPDAARARLNKLKKELDLDFLIEDMPTLMGESKEGITRVKKIVQDLKDFSRVDSAAEWQFANLHKGIDSTLNIVNNEIKYKADVIKDYGEIPEVECMPSQINQVVMNLAVNAAHAMGETRGTITVRTGCTADNVWIEIVDNGSGIPEEIRQKIFDPFFTTKPVGKGTGLGLSLSYGIIQNHHGSIEVMSDVGKGTTFRVTLPVLQPKDEEAT